MRQENTADLSPDGAEEDGEKDDWSQDPSAVSFVSILAELGAEKIFAEYDLSLLLLFSFIRA